MFYRAFFTTLIATVALFMVLGFEPVTLHQYFKITTGSLFGVVGLFAMLQVIKKSSLQWLGIYNLIGVVFTTFYLITIKDINISSSLLGAIIILIGFALFLYSNKQTQLKLTSKQHLLLLLMAVCFSVSSLIHWENVTSSISPLLIISNQEFMVLLLGGFATVKNRREIQFRLQSKTYFFPTLWMSGVIFFALLLSLLGLKDTDPFIASVLFLATPLTTIIFSSLFFKERITLMNAIAVVLIALGAFFLHYLKSV
jgi:drug/metabolite transporter (DMT)-like permease